MRPNRYVGISVGSLCSTSRSTTSNPGGEQLKYLVKGKVNLNDMIDPN